LKKVLRKEEVWFSIKAAICGCCGNKTDVIYLEGERNITKGGDFGGSNNFSSPLVCLNCMKRIQNIIKEELNVVMLQKKANSGAKDTPAGLEAEEEMEELQEEA
jgi:hypothetical protein